MSVSPGKNFASSEISPAASGLEVPPDFAGQTVKSPGQSSGLQGFIAALMTAHRYVQNRRTAMASLYMNDL